MVFIRSPSPRARLKQKKVRAISGLHMVNVLCGRSPMVAMIVTGTANNIAIIPAKRNHACLFRFITPRTMAIILIRQKINHSIRLKGTSNRGERKNAKGIKKRPGIIFKYLKK